MTCATVSNKVKTSHVALEEGSYSFTCLESVQEHLQCCVIRTHERYERRFVGFKARSRSSLLPIGFGICEWNKCLSSFSQHAEVLSDNVTLFMHMGVQYTGALCGL